MASAITSASTPLSRMRSACSTPYSSMVSTTSLLPFRSTSPARMRTVSSASRTGRINVKIRMTSRSFPKRNDRKFVLLLQCVSPGFRHRCSNLSPESNCIFRIMFRKPPKDCHPRAQHIAFRYSPENMLRSSLDDMKRADCVVLRHLNGQRAAALHLLRTQNGGFERQHFHDHVSQRAHNFLLVCQFISIFLRGCARTE